MAPLIVTSSSLKVDSPWIEDFDRLTCPGSIIRRAASVEEVAHMIVYACTPQASATTGASLRVDGGVVETL